MNMLSTLDGRVMKSVSQEESRGGNRLGGEVWYAILMLNSDFPLFILSKDTGAFSTNHKLIYYFLQNVDESICVCIMQKKGGRIFPLGMKELCLNEDI